MMMTFNAMRRSLQQWRIIWLLVTAPAIALALGGCSSVRLLYNQGPDLTQWWLDGYVDFTDEQAPRVRESLREWFGWHRSTQLPLYADFLSRFQDQLPRPIDPDAACALQVEALALLNVSTDRALPLAAGYAAELDADQLRFLRQRFERVNKEFRDEFLQEDLQERRRENVKRTVERAERLYGRLDDAQAARVAERLAGSPFNPELWLAERVARQQDLLALLQSASVRDNGTPTPEVRSRLQAALRTLADQVLKSPRPAYRDYQQRLTAYNCKFFSQLHAETSAEQRQRALDNVKGWQDDLRALAGQGAR